jgi:hypothetical protein
MPHGQGSQKLCLEMTKDHISKVYMNTERLKSFFNWIEKPKSK